MGNVAIVDAKRIRERLDAAIQQSVAARAVTWVSEQKDVSPEIHRRAAMSRIIQQFRGFRVGAIATTGLVDGVNPCAFTTIVFLLSMLTYLGRSRTELAIVGTSFTSAVFFTRLLLGLGMLTAVKQFSMQSGLARGLAYFVGISALVLAVWSLVDCIRYWRTRDAKTVTLGLPRAVKERIHAVIRNGMKSRNLLIGALGVGCLVALLEFMCTGQLYLPTIVFVARTPGMRASAAAYLLTYNFMSSLPLMAIIAVAYFGVKSDVLGRLLRKHLAVVKLALAVVFAGLGILVIATV